MIKIYSNILNYITAVQNMSEAKIEISDVITFVESKAKETYVPYDYVSAIRQGATMFREITSSLDPFGVVDSVYCINDSLNKNIDVLVSNADSTISAIDQAVKNCNQSVVNLTSAVTTATLTIDKLSKNVDKLTNQLMSLTMELVQLGEQAVSDLATLTAEITDFILQTVNTGKDVNSFIKKIVPGLIIGGLACIAIIACIFILRKRREYGDKNCFNS